MADLLFVTFAVLLALAIAATLVYWYVRDITQKQHAILRNFPIVGHLRYFFEKLGEYFRQYFFIGDREERPFDRATRSWNYSDAIVCDQPIITFLDDQAQAVRIHTTNGPVDLTAADAQDQAAVLAKFRAVEEGMACVK